MARARSKDDKWCGAVLEKRPSTILEMVEDMLGRGNGIPNITEGILQDRHLLAVIIDRKVALHHI
ncbi:hypothetical protein EJB05_01527, partial [Eragrostis curvula]